MSLFDTLIVQEYFQPPVISGSTVFREVFIAIRNDRPPKLLDTVLWGMERAASVADLDMSTLRSL